MNSTFLNAIRNTIYDIGVYFFAFRFKFFSGFLFCFLSKNYKPKTVNLYLAPCTLHLATCNLLQITYHCFSIRSTLTSDYSLTTKLTRILVIFFLTS